jgi:S1-C subfamily serine protease
MGIFWKKTGSVCIVLAALTIVGYAQTTSRAQLGRSANIQVPSNAGYLGVGAQDITPERAKALNLKDTSGIEVTNLVEESPASKAGLRIHDLILDANGQKVESWQQFVEFIADKSPGTKVNLLISRNGVKQTMTATLTLRPAEIVATPVPPGFVTLSPEDLKGLIAAQSAVETPQIGFICTELMPQLAEFFGAIGGVLVESVTAGTAAGRAGLKAGDVISKVNGLPIANIRELQVLIRMSAKKPITFTVVRNKKEISLNVELALNRDPSDRDAAN